MNGRRQLFLDARFVLSAVVGGLMFSGCGIQGGQAGLNNRFTNLGFANKEFPSGQVVVERTVKASNDKQFVAQAILDQLGSAESSTAPLVSSRFRTSAFSRSFGSGGSVMVSRQSPRPSTVNDAQTIEASQRVFGFGPLPSYSELLASDGLGNVVGMSEDNSRVVKAVIHLGQRVVISTTAKPQVPADLRTEDDSSREDNTHNNQGSDAATNVDERKERIAIQRVTAAVFQDPSITAPLQRVESITSKPLWYAPDEYFTRRKLVVPPPHSRDRYLRGAYGTKAILLESGLVIHNAPLVCDETTGVSLDSADFESFASTVAPGDTVGVLVE